MKPLQRLSRWTYTHARRVVVLVVGGTVVLFGVLLLVMPGPGILLILGGLGILAVEFAWARRLLRRVRRQVGELGDSIQRSRRVGGRKRPEEDPPGPKTDR